jgi:hypothetical protein
VAVEIIEILKVLLKNLLELVEHAGLESGLVFFAFGFGG